MLFCALIFYVYATTTWLVCFCWLSSRRSLLGDITDCCIFFACQSNKGLIYENDVAQISFSLGCHSNLRAFSSWFTETHKLFRPKHHQFAVWTWCWTPVSEVEPISPDQRGDLYEITKAKTGIENVMIMNTEHLLLPWNMQLFLKILHTNCYITRGSNGIMVKSNQRCRSCDSKINTGC